MSTSRALTSALSAKTENRMIKYMLIKYGRMKTQMIMFTVFSCLSYPLLAIGVLTQFYDNNYSVSTSFAVLSAIICVISLAGIALLMIGIPNGNYDYFSRRTVVDMNYSLPITNNERFWGDFLIGIIPTALLHFLSICVGMFILLLGRGLYVESMGDGVIGVEALNEEYSNILSICFKLAIIGFLALISLYIIVSFACSLSGRAFENWLTLGMIIIFIPSIVAICIYMPFFDVREMDISMTALDVTAVISPVMFVVKALSTAGISNSLTNELNLLDPVIVVPFILFNAAIILATYFISITRRVEKVGDAFAHNPTSTILLGGLLFTIISLFCMAIRQEVSFNGGGDVLSLVVTMIIISFIAFLVFEVLTKRSFKRIHIGLLKYAGMIVGTVILSSALFSANGFGLQRYVPNANDVKWAEINGVNLYGMDEYFAPSSYYRYSAVVFESPDGIEDIIELHKAAVNNSNNTGNYSEVITVKYCLKNGAMIERRLYIPIDKTGILLNFAFSDEVKSSMLDGFRANLFDFQNNRNPVNITRTAYAVDMLGENVVSVNIKDYEAFFEAYKKDLMALTIEDVYENPRQPLFRLTLSVKAQFDDDWSSDFGFTGVMNILPQYKNTLALIQGLIGENRLPEMNFEGKAVNLVRLQSVGNYEKYQYPEVWYNGMDVEYVKDVLGENADMNIKPLDINDPQHRALLEVFIPAMDARVSNCYAIDIDGSVFYIPNKYYDLAETVFNEIPGH